MINNCVLIVLFAMASIVNAQTDSVYVFKFKKKQIGCDISPKYNFLFQNVNHPIKLNTEIVDYDLELFGGSVLQTDSGLFLKPIAPKEAIFKVATKQNNKDTVVFLKSYNVLPEPKAYLRNKPTDNAMQDILVLSAELKVYSFYKEKKIALPVKSFKLVYPTTSRSFESMDIKGSFIPVDLRKTLVDLPEGTMLYYENIMVELDKDFEVEIAPYRITFIKINPAEVIRF